MSKILVTGGAGFIGSNIVDAFIEAGHEVVVVDSLLTGFRKNVNPKARFYEIDIRDAALADVFAKEKPQVVDHLAAQMDVRRSVEEPVFDAQVNVMGTVNLLENCARHGVEKFLFASTGGAIYGDVPEAELPVAESYVPKPVSHYATSKFCGEQYIGLYSRLYGLKYTILRYANVFGPRQNPHGEAGVCAILTALMLEGKPATLFGFGEPTRDYVYVGDIARANLLALEKGDGETVNLGTGRGTSVLEIFNTLKQLTGYGLEPNLKPLRPGEIGHIYLAAGKAREVLGWSPEVSLEEGLRRTLEHVKVHA